VKYRRSRHRRRLDGLVLLLLLLMWFQRLRLDGDVCLSLPLHGLELGQGDGVSLTLLLHGHVLSAVLA